MNKDLQSEQENKKSCLTYSDLKDAYEGATFIQLVINVNGMKELFVKYALYVIAFSIAIFLVLVTKNSMSVTIFLIIVGLFSGWRTYSIIKFDSTKCLEEKFNEINRIRTYHSDWLGARYEYFKNSIDLKKDVCDYEKLYAQIVQEKELFTASFWDHRLFVTGVSFVLVGWAAVAKMLASGTSQQQGLLVAIVLIALALLPMLGIFLDSIKTEEKK